MKLSIAKVKVCDFASHETTCFECVVLLDGKVVGTAENNGHGGSTNVHFNDRKVRDSVDAYAKSHPPLHFPEHDLTFAATADSLIDQLLESYIALKDRLNLIRKLTNGMQKKGESYYRLLKGQERGRYFVVKNGLAGMAVAVAQRKAKNETIVVFDAGNPGPFIDSLSE